MRRGAAGWTAAGMLSPRGGTASAPTHGVFELGLRSLALWPQIVWRCSDAPVQFSAATAACCWRIAATKARRGAGANCSTRKAPPAPRAAGLDAAALRELEPAVQGRPHAWLLPCEGQDPYRAGACDALARGAAASRWHWAQRGRRVSSPACCM